MEAKTEPFDKYYDKYEDWFERNKFVYKSELKAVAYFINKNEKGIEIGVGSGKFAAPLGIKHGIDPSNKMRKLAEKRGINVQKGVGESLDFSDESFDFVLMVTTICFLDDIEKSFKEVKRVLIKKGNFIIGFVDKNSDLGKQYLEKKDENVFYKKADFYSAENILQLLKRLEFHDIEVVQTIFGNLTDINKIQNFKEGYGEGGFVVIKANK
ncbi:MAG: class I SAM-dependent methyltransferase [Halanaerobiales bacterium]|nr:class I SAM-dependent methyltransferase [Halanaerobiales bacterium]